MDHLRNVKDIFQETAVPKSLEFILEEAQNTGQLILTAKKLRDLPAFIIYYDLSDLYLIDLSKNRLVDLPCFLKNFLSLEQLKCHHNLIRSIPPSISSFKHMVVLDLSHNLLSTFPAHACEFKCLQILKISCNRISSLPDDIGQLRSLMELNVSRNKIAEFPNSMANLTSLKLLDAHHNRLKFLNPDLASLTLVKLDVSVNELTKIPLEFHNVASLDEFNISGNPLVSPPQHVVLKGRQHIMSFLALEYNKQQRQRKGAMYESKSERKRLSSSSTSLRSFSLDDQRSSKKMLHSGCSMGSIPIDDEDLLINRKNEKYSEENAVNNGFVVVGDDDDHDGQAQTKLILDDEQSEFYKRYSLLVSNRRMEREKVVEVLVGDELPKRRKNSDSSSPKCKKLFEALQGKLGDHDPLLTIRRNIHQVARENAQITSLRKMLRALLKTELVDDIGESIKDGVLLCELANQILPNSVPKIYKPTPDSILSQSKSRKNVESFLNACRRIGLMEIECQNIKDVVPRNYGSNISFLEPHHFDRKKEFMVTSPSLRDRLVGTFCMVFFLCTCLYLYSYPLPS